MRFFASEDKQRRTLLLTHCPQAVVLAVMLKAEIEASSLESEALAAASLRSTTETLTALLAKAISMRSSYKAPIAWYTKPWGDVLNAAQRRSGVVLFPIGENQNYHSFHVDYVQASNWSIWSNRRCHGRRDLGNLQGTPLPTCLAKCAAHPSCRSATFWHYIPPGFEQRCFLSSTCTSALSTNEGADGAVLFEKKEVLSAEDQERMRQRMRTPGGAAWAPRAGHRLLASPLSPNSGAVRLWLLGGVGVDPFAPSKDSAEEKSQEKQKQQEKQKVGTDGSDKGKKSGKGKGASDANKPSMAERASRRRANVTSSDVNVIEAYLSRHVELSGGLPPLRSLPYGRLGDVWRSDDAGASWTRNSRSAPWGPRAFFGAVALVGGRGLLVMGGVRTPATRDNGNFEGLTTEYVNDVWFTELAASGELPWRELPGAAWEPRASFQVLSWSHPGEEDEVLLLGGRVKDGSLRNDVWAVRVGHDFGLAGSTATWRLLTGSAAWSPRSEFAATSSQQRLWLLGGSDVEGRPMADVWRSSDARSWQQVQAAAPWGPRLGAAAVGLASVLEGSSEAVEALVIFGGFGYPDNSWKSLPPRNVTYARAPAWSSVDGGSTWEPVDSERLGWMQGSLYTAAATAPCEPQVANTEQGNACAYFAGGISNEGYYDNTVLRLHLPDVPGRIKETSDTSPDPDADLSTPPPTTKEAEEWPFEMIALAVVFSVAALGWLRCCRKSMPADPVERRVCRWLIAAGVALLFVFCMCGMAMFQLAREIQQLRSDAPRCQVDNTTVGVLWEAMGLGQASERWEQFETLLRLASREPQFGYGGLGGYGGGRGGYGDIYGREKGGYDSYYGGYGGGSGAYGDDPFAPPSSQQSKERDETPEAQLKRELSTLPTTQSLSCRTPKCDRNASTCDPSVPRSLKSPYGCCNDYMLLMLGDVADYLKKNDIPYFIAYGTLLGAVRENDIMPWTQDMDLVVDRSHWPKLQRGLEAAEFFGGRRYLFGVDQWEERVSRVCADWEGFATSIIGGAEDKFTRPADFYLDIYSSDWWQITDMHLVDCVEPLGVVELEIRGRNFSAPARPRACVEKLYGAEWRTPKKALAGVN